MGMDFEAYYAQARPSVTHRLLLMPVDQDEELTSFSSTELLLAHSLPYPAMMIMD